MYCCRFSPSLTPSLHSPLYPPPLSPFLPPSLSPIFPPSSFSLPSVSLFIHVTAVCVRACVCCRVTKIDDYEIVQIRLPRHIAADSVRHTHHAHALTHTPRTCTHTHVHHCTVRTVICPYSCCMCPLSSQIVRPYSHFFASGKAFFMVCMGISLCNASSTSPVQYSIGIYVCIPTAYVCVIDWSVVAFDRQPVQSTTIDIMYLVKSSPLWQVHAPT